jgi:hypothetical protein
VKTLRRKLVRDLWRLRYQCATIAILVGCGVASFVAAVSASASVQASRSAFYADARFADVFAHLKRAPRPVLDRLRELPGVAHVDGRVNVVLDPDSAADAWMAIGDGFAAEVEITVWSKPDVVQVPTSALFRRGDGWAVFVVTGGRAVVRGVQVGRRGSLQAEVQAGLSPGESVVIHPGASVHEGARVASR